jgi:multidrug transporter EmrE-like cation transporter
MKINGFIDHLYIFCSIALGVYSTVMMKWQVRAASAFPVQWGERFKYILDLFLNPWILSSFCATFLAGVLWMIVMTKFKISYAYPFASLGYALVLVLSALLFGEPITWCKVIGVGVIMLGIAVACQG